MGGLVARQVRVSYPGLTSRLVDSVLNLPQAMIRLHDYSHKSEYQGLKLEYCGLLFLSTPHSGTTEADWNKFLVGIGKMTWGIRTELIDSLRAFNPLSTASQEHFANMKIQPPF